MNCVRLYATLFMAFALVPFLKGQDKKDINFFELKAQWQKRLSEKEETKDENGALDSESEDGDLAKFNRWVHLWRYRLGPNGEMTTASEAINRLNLGGRSNNGKAEQMICDSPDDNGVNWTNLGPLNSQGALGSNNGSNSCSGYLANKQNQGRLECISVKPNNANEILVGAFNGGVWRSTNGGTSWTNTTDDEGYSIYGISSIVRHPADPNVVYASTSVNGGLWEGSRSVYGMGVIVSTNGGVTWQPTGLTYTTYGNWNSQLGKLAIDPNSTLTSTKLYVCSSSDIWKWQGTHLAASAWTSVYSDPQYYGGPLWWAYVNNMDIECASNGDTWFANFKGLFKIPNGSNTPALVTTYTIPPAFVNQTACGSPSQNLKQEINIEMNTQGHIVFYCKFTVNNTTCNGTSNGKYFYKSTDNGLTWTSVSTIVDGFQPQEFTISPKNSDIIYAERGGGDRCMAKSTNGGASFTNMGNSHNHVDVRYLLAYSGTQTNGSDDVLYLATDGGISKTINGQAWTDITGQGMSLTNYYGAAISETNDKMILAGAQDGSINYYNNGSFYETLPGGDNGDCLINPSNNSMVFQEYQGALGRGTISGNNVTGITYYSPVSNWMNPLCWNPSTTNEFFIGTTKLYLGTTTSTALTAIYDANFHPPKNISSVAASRKNPNVVYYSTDSYWWNDNIPPTATDREGIFRATRSGTTWTITDITNNLKTKCINGTCGLPAPITDIAVDPNDENRIWVTFGNFVSNQKVFFSNDGGANWQNLVSNCLPNLPVTAIAFQEMSNDRIYIGTDNGIYYRDNIQTDWAKYGNNGSQCMVNDLEINQCAGKLVVATHGRGLWEAPTIKSPEGTILSSSTPITWSTPRTIAADVRIVSGTTLNISNTTINIGQGVKITVEAGAKLQISNSTLTNSCGYVWDGIKVWGNSTLVQNSTNQGTLIIDYSTIEHAIEAIEVVKPGDMTKTGGIVKATNSNFLNNKRSVAYYQYLTSVNQGYFYNCVFKTDANYRHSLSILSHLSMWAVNGIKIAGCTFETNNTWAYDANRVQGITAIDANFTVDVYCTGIVLPCTPEIRCKFKGLNKAINTSRTTGAYTFSVYKSDFENNVFGIITTAHNNFNVRACTFKVGKTNASGAPSTHEGIVIMSGTGFNVDQNTFQPSFTSIAPNTIGIRAKDTGTEVNEIYKNTFSKLSPTDLNVFYGNLANGLNRNTAIPNNGLKYFCNTNTNNKKNGYDVAVTDQGISYAQGSLSYAAKNNFSWGTTANGAPVGSDYNNGASTGVITYYYNLNAQEEPLNIFALSKFLTSSTANNCPDRYNTGGGTASAMAPPSANAILSTQYAEAKQNLEQERATLNKLLDGGNSLALINAIQHSKADEKEEILKQLKEISPFVSKEALEALLAQIDQLLSKDELLELVTNNPDAFANGMLAESLLNSGHFDKTEINNLQEAIGQTITERTILESNISDLQSLIFSICNQGLSVISENPEVFSPYDLVVWLSNKNTLTSDMAIVDLFIDQHNYAEATMLLYSLKEKYPLTDDELQALHYFIQVKEIQMSVFQNGTGTDQLGQDVLSLLEPIAIDGKGLAGDQARAILNQNGYSFFVPPVFPTGDKTEKLETDLRTNDTQTDKESSSVTFDKLSAAPNPASSEVHFNYALRGQVTGYIVLRDNTGKIVTKLTVKNNAGTLTWKCGDVLPGIYFYSLENDNEMLIEPKRLLLIR